jgi:hypothetical protein
MEWPETDVWAGIPDFSIETRGIHEQREPNSENESQYNQQQVIRRIIAERRADDDSVEYGPEEK